MGRFATCAIGLESGEVPTFGRHRRRPYPLGHPGFTHAYEFSPPHRDRTGYIVVQNGIVKNFLALHRELMAEGFRFQSDMDTEVIAQLITREYDRCEDLTEAVLRALNLLRGPSAVVVLSSHESHWLMVARFDNAGGVVIGHGQGKMFVASHIPAILEHTRTMSFLDDWKITVLTREGVAYYDRAGRAFPPKPIHTISWGPVLENFNTVHTAHLGLGAIADRTGHPLWASLPEAEYAAMRQGRPATFAAIRACLT